MSKAKPVTAAARSEPSASDPRAQQLKTLGLYVMAERYRPRADEATKAKSPYTHSRAALVSAQLAARMDRSFRDRLARARFPRIQTLKEFDFTFQPTLDERYGRALADLSLLTQQENVLLVGPPGVGKTQPGDYPSRRDVSAAGDGACHRPTPSPLRADTHPPRHL
jgi:flagellar biosynthesis GTPase FlhF